MDETKGPDEVLDEQGTGTKTTKKKGFCLRCIDSVWMTRKQKADEGDQEAYVRRTFKELIIYMVFLIFVVIISFGMKSNNMFMYTRVMMDLFLKTEFGKDGGGKTFETITSVADFWEYASGPLIDGLYWEKWYNGKSEPLTNGYIYYENKLLGPPRLRQLRVHTNSCRVNEEFENFISECYAEYSIKQEDTEGFATKSTGNGTAWRYQAMDVVDGFEYEGEIGVKYSGGGYVQDLTMKKSESEDIIKDLKANLWIQRGARALLIHFTVYNANINLFSIITLSVEFPATGGAITGYTFYTVKLLRYVTIWDTFVLVSEVIFFLFILYYMTEEFLEILSNGCVYFKNIWNLLDLLLIALSLVILFWNLYRNGYVTRKLEEYTQNKDKHTSFYYQGYWETNFSNIMAITVFFAWVKVFKYISFNKTMTQLSTTLKRCAKDLLGFFIMFFIVFLAFTQLGFLLFGTQVNDFSTFSKAFFTLFRIILGDFDFHQLEQANRILGPVFFMTFVFFVFFVLINMFLAIINDTYSEVKSDMAKQQDQFIMADYLKKTFNTFWTKVKKTDNADGVDRVLITDIGSDTKMDFRDWKDELQRQGFSDDEVAAVFVKFDVDEDRTLDPSEQKKMLTELEKLKAAELAKPAAKHEPEHDGDSDDEGGDAKEQIHMDEYMILVRRVDRMESTFGGIIANIDIVLEQLALIKT